MVRVYRLQTGKDAGLVESAPDLRAAQMGAGSGAVLAGVQQCRPGNGCGQGSYFAEHYFDDVADGVGRIFGPPRAFQPAVDEQLQQVEGEDPKQQDGHQSVGGMAKNMSEVQVLDPLVEGGIQCASGPE